MQSPEGDSAAAANEGPGFGLRSGLSRAATVLQSPRVRRPLSIALNLLVLGLLAIILYDNRQDLPLLARLVSWRLLAVCALWYTASFGVQLYVWADMTGFRRGEWLEAIEQYVRTTFMARLPGGLWKFVGRMTVYRAPRISARSALTVSLLEVLLLLVTAGVLLLIVAPLPWLLRAGGLLVLLLLCGILVLRMSHLVPGLAERRPIRWLWWMASYAASWVFGALMLYAIAAELAHPIALAQAVQFWCIAGTAGIALQILPVSALFRDGALALLLQAAMPLHVAVIATLALRVMLAVFEVVIGWGLLGVQHLAVRRSGQADPAPQAAGPQQPTLPEHLTDRDLVETRQE